MLWEASCPNVDHQLPVSMWSHYIQLQRKSQTMWILECWRHCFVKIIWLLVCSSHAVVQKVLNFGKTCSLHLVCWTVSLQPRIWSCLAVQKIPQLLQKPECSSCHHLSLLLDPMLIQYNSHHITTTQISKDNFHAIPYYCNILDLLTLMMATQIMASFGI